MFVLLVWDVCFFLHKRKQNFCLLCNFVFLATSGHRTVDSTKKRNSENGFSPGSEAALEHRTVDAKTKTHIIPKVVSPQTARLPLSPGSEAAPERRTVDSKKQHIILKIVSPQAAKLPRSTGQLRCCTRRTSSCCTRRTSSYCTRRKSSC